MQANVEIMIRAAENGSYCRCPAIAGRIGVSWRPRFSRAEKMRREMIGGRAACTRWAGVVGIACDLLCRLAFIVLLKVNSLGEERPEFLCQIIIVAAQERCA